MKKEVIELLKKADKCLAVTEDCVVVNGKGMDLLFLFSMMTTRLLENTTFSKEDLHKALSVGFEIYDREKDEEIQELNIDKELDKKLETIEKLVDILKDLRKGDK